MKLTELVKDIHGGFNKSTSKRNYLSDTYSYKELTIKSVNNKFVNQDYLEDFDSIFEIDEKYITKIDDIVISKKTYNAILINKENEGILVPNNFIILRDISINKNFLYNYLNLLSDRMKMNLDDKNTDLTITEVQDIDIPKLNEKSLEKISLLISKINIRQQAYAKLLDNDQELIKLLFDKMGVNCDE